MKTTGTHDKFFALLRGMPGAEKEQIVWQYSNMLTTSLREFYARDPEGYKRMIVEMQEKAQGSGRRAQGDPQTPQGRLNTAETKKLRSAILKRLQKHGVDTSDWTRVNTFLVQPRIAGKLLFEMNADEMRRLIAKLEQILRKDAEVREHESKLSECN